MHVFTCWCSPVAFAKFGCLSGVIYGLWSGRPAAGGKSMAKPGLLDVRGRFDDGPPSLMPAVSFPGARWRRTIWPSRVVASAQRRFSGGAMSLRDRVVLFRLIAGVSGSAHAVRATRSSTLATTRFTAPPSLSAWGGDGMDQLGRPRLRQQGRHLLWFRLRGACVPKDFGPAYASAKPRGSATDLLRSRRGSHRVGLHSRNCDHRGSGARGGAAGGGVVPSGAGPMAAPSGRRATAGERRALDSDDREAPAGGDAEVVLAQFHGSRRTWAGKPRRPAAARQQFVEIRAARLVVVPLLGEKVRDAGVLRGERHRTHLGCGSASRPFDGRGQHVLDGPRLSQLRQSSAPGGIGGRRFS
mgnify:CR=1 FL=1